MSDLRTARRQELWRRVWQDRLLYLLVAPMILYFAVFQYKPLYFLQIAFKDYDIFAGPWKSEWIGLENFIYFVTGPFFVRVLGNTLLISLYSIVFGFPIPIVLALMFHEMPFVRTKKVLQTVVYLPHFISIVIVAGLVVNLLAPVSGVVNLFMERIGMERIHFMARGEFFKPIFVATGIWKESGFAAVIYIAALSGIDMELYDAVIVDGGNRWQKLWYVTLPGILPTIAVMLILRISRILEVGFERVILLYQPATYDKADVISSYVYRIGLQEGEYALATAVSLMNMVIALVLVVTANALSKRTTEYGLW